MNIEINGVTLQADFMDAGFMETLEPALKDVQQQMVTLRTKKHDSVAAGYRELNQLIEGFFDRVFEPDTSYQIFNGSQNVLMHLEALAKVQDQSKRATKEFNDFTNRYSQRQKASGFNSMQGHQQKQKPQPQNREHTNR